MPNHLSRAGNFVCGECGKPHIEFFVISDAEWARCGEDYALCFPCATVRLGCEPKKLSGEEATHISLGWKLPEIWGQRWL